jgi:hypothetical protein
MIEYGIWERDGESVYWVVLWVLIYNQANHENIS